MTSRTLTDSRPTLVEHSDDTIDHMACCHNEVGQPGPNLCGGIDITGDGDFDEVPPEDRCVVCEDLDQQDYCPRFTICLYGEERE